MVGNKYNCSYLALFQNKQRRYLHAGEGIAEHRDQQIEQHHQRKEAIEHIEQQEARKLDRLRSRELAHVRIDEDADRVACTRRAVVVWGSGVGLGGSGSGSGLEWVLGHLGRPSGRELMMKG